MIRERTARKVLEGRFTKEVMTQQAGEIKSAQDKIITKRSKRGVLAAQPRTFKPSDAGLEMGLTTVVRFTDIRKRKSKQGIRRKRSYPIYNRIIFGHLNNMVRQLQFGFTDAIIEEMKKLED